jgi:hypothetical protein
MFAFRFSFAHSVDSISSGIVSRKSFPAFGPMALHRLTVAVGNKQQIDAYEREGARQEQHRFYLGSGSQARALSDTLVESSEPC